MSSSAPNNSRRGRLRPCAGRTGPCVCAARAARRLLPARCRPRRRPWGSGAPAVSPAAGGPGAWAPSARPTQTARPVPFCFGSVSARVSLAQRRLGTELIKQVPQRAGINPGHADSSLEHGPRRDGRSPVAGASRPHVSRGARPACHAACEARARGWGPGQAPTRRGSGDMEGRSGPKPGPLPGLPPAHAGPRGRGSPGFGPLPQSLSGALCVRPGSQGCRSPESRAGRPLRLLGATTRVAVASARAPSLGRWTLTGERRPSRNRRRRPAPRRPGWALCALDTGRSPRPFPRPCPAAPAGASARCGPRRRRRNTHALATSSTRFSGRAPGRSHSRAPPSPGLAAEYRPRGSV